MITSIPKLGDTLSPDHKKFLETFTKSCRHSIVQMTTIAQSGHPGGSLSTLDYLATLYAFILSQTGEKIVVSHGHISPAVYSVLAELGYINKEDAVKNFRKYGTKYEGHVSRHVEGVFYGTGPLGAGVSAGAAFALAEKLKKTDKKVYTLMGDGETQEGQVHEMIHFAKHHALNNLILFVDSNKVQLTASLKDTLDIDVHKIFEAGHWHIIEIDGHNFEEIWNALSEAQKVKDKPVVIIGNTIMGKGVPFMEEDGKVLNSCWHGKPPTEEQSNSILKESTPTPEEEKELKSFHSLIKWTPEKPEFPKPLSALNTKTGAPITYSPDEKVACRNAYGKTLLDLAKLNKNIIALTADVSTSVMTKYLAEELPEQYIECGITEQHMVTAAGALSLCGFIPFASTFAAFMGSRAKDQARLNDINDTNVKMVSSHAGLSVGEDGPTHQAIDDMSSFLGLLNTMVIEPADANQTDHIIRYIASHYGNFYVRFGRNALPILTKEDRSPLYDENYVYEYGRTDIVKEGTDITIAASGAMVHQTLEALKQTKVSAELIAVSSIKKFDDTLINSIKKTKKLLTIEDHNSQSGLGSQLAHYLAQHSIKLDKFRSLGVTEYQLSGKPDELYKNSHLDPDSIVKTLTEMA